MATDDYVMMMMVGDDEDNDGVIQLMKLNEDWDQVYRSATLRLQHRMESLELENTAIKELNNRLLLKVEHQQVNTPQNFRVAHWCVSVHTRTIEQTYSSLYWYRA